MPAQWTGRLIGEMHLNSVTQRQIAKELGVSAEYVNSVLNGRKTPRDAEERFFQAYYRIVGNDRKELC